MSRSLLLPGDRPLVHLALLGTTLVTCTYAFGCFLGGWRWQVPATWDLSTALPFSLAAVAILGSHEMGHYVYARIHGVATTLPFFIPLPLPFGFGTLGAVIRIKSRIPTRNALIDIGAAGPLAGVIVAIPIIIWGLAQSEFVDTIPSSEVFPPENSLMGILNSLASYIAAQVDGSWVAKDAFFGGLRFGDNLLMQGLIWMVHGSVPAGKELVGNPLVMAGWFGLLVTMLNLCPIGQLDGGHVAFAVFGRHARWIGKAGALLLLGFTLFANVNWLLWFILTSKLIGFDHPEVTDPSQPLTFGRKLVAFACLALFVLCLLPSPVEQVWR